MLTISHNGTTKQRPRLDLDGYSYVKDRITNEKIYWRCFKYSSDRCHSRLHTCLSSATVLKLPSEHCCKFDGTTNELRAFSQQVADRALNTQETPDTILTNCYKGMRSLIFLEGWWKLTNRFFRSFWSIPRSSSNPRQHQTTHSNAPSGESGRQGASESSVSISSSSTNNQSSSRDFLAVWYWSW